VIALAALAARALFPPTAFDATMYHLPLVKGWVIDHRIAPALTLRYPVFAQLNEVLFAAVFLFGGELAPHLIELALLALTCGLLFVWGRRWFSPRAGALAAALLLASPLVLYLSTVGYIDVGLMHFVTLGFFALARHGDDGERALVWIAGAALACAADCKYLGLFFFAPAGLWICATAFKRKTPRAPFELAAVVLLVALPF
jgi:4-amino-4-deoxy-L-arabinose transferase-like glycosyltransferase